MKQAHRLMSNAFNKQHPLTYPNVSDRYTVLAKTFQRVWQHWRPLILVPVWCAGAFGLVTVRLRIIQKERRSVWAVSDPSGRANLVLWIIRRAVRTRGGSCQTSSLCSGGQMGHSRGWKAVCVEALLYLYCTHCYNPLQLGWAIHMYSVSL